MKRFKRIGSIVGAVSLAVVLAACSTDSSTEPADVEAAEEEVVEEEAVTEGESTHGITEDEVLAFQQSWGEGIVHIGEVYSEGGDYEAAAIEHIERFYGYDMSEVLFKPTLALEERHRGTFESALSYFIGGDIAEDSGFAVTPWSDVRWENEGVLIEGNKATTMGVYYFTPANGGEPVEVEYTFAFTKNDDGDLKIVLHSSHLPFSAAQSITEDEIAAAQVAWGEGLVDISTAYAAGEDYGTIAQNVLDNLYGYVDGTVLFKPTLTQEPYTFRFTEEGAAAYFIGTDRSQDGFALKPWTAVEFDSNGEFSVNGDIALWMGNVHITNDEGEVTTVDKTFGYYKDANGDVRINLHHSSLPISN